MQRAAVCAVGSDTVEAFRSVSLVAADLGGLDPSYPANTPPPARRSPPPEVGRALKPRPTAGRKSLVSSGQTRSIGTRSLRGPDGQLLSRGTLRAVADAVPEGRGLQSQ